MIKALPYLISPILRDGVAPNIVFDDELLVASMSRALRLIPLAAIENAATRACAYVRAGLTQSAEDDKRLSELDPRALKVAGLDPLRADRTKVRSAA